MKKYVVISGLMLDENNRGTAALGYGSFCFLKQKECLSEYKIINFYFYKNFLKFWNKKSIVNEVRIGESVFCVETQYMFFLFRHFITFFGIKSSFFRLNKILKETEYVATINGGDGFSDIYGTKTFKSRLRDINLAMIYKIPLIILPQTLGPFSQESNYKLAVKILRYSTKIYVRDLSFKQELDMLNLNYELSNDLSFYMLPEKIIDLKILPSSVGLNVSGLAYSNQFRALANRFDEYPFLVEKIISMFQENNIPVYLVSHSFNYSKPEKNNDDLEANKALYNFLKNKQGVYLIDSDLSSPQIKYLISQFEFFIGTRMHACFAAIYTKTPLFGLSYSYKFKGAFDEYGLNSNYANILDLKNEDVSVVLNKIKMSYTKRDLIKYNLSKL